VVGDSDGLGQLDTVPVEFAREKLDHLVGGRWLAAAALQGAVDRNRLRHCLSPAVTPAY
jgi:hypothetical protein